MIYRPMLMAKGGGPVPPLASSAAREELSDDTKARLSVLMVIADIFSREHSHTMTVQVYRTFLAVAMNQGRSIMDYAEELGVSKSVMSRHILDLSVKRRNNEQGFGLLYTRPRPEELRRHEVFLTPTGRALARRIDRALQFMQQPHKRDGEH